MCRAHAMMCDYIKNSILTHTEQNKYVEKYYAKMQGAQSVQEDLNKAGNFFKFQKF